MLPAAGLRTRKQAARTAAVAARSLAAEGYFYQPGSSTIVLD